MSEHTAISKASVALVHRLGQSFLGDAVVDLLPGGQVHVVSLETPRTCGSRRKRSGGQSSSRDRRDTIHRPDLECGGR
jgi:hypothetical protein